MMMYKLGVLSLLCTFVTSVTGQFQHIEFDFLKVENDLPHSTINDIIQDSIGYIWFATDDGLCYYDNYNFKTYRNSESDTSGLTSNQAYALHLDQNGDVWVGTKQSLGRYDKKKGELTHLYLCNSPDNELLTIIEIIQDNDSTLLLGTDGGGLREFNMNTKKENQFLPKEFVETVGDRIASLYKDKNGCYWIGTIAKGLFLFKPGKNGTAASLTPYIPKAEIRSIVSYNNNELLVSSYGLGLFKFNLDTQAYSPFDLPIVNASSLRVFDLHLHNGLLYIGTDGDGLLRYNLDSYELVKLKNHGRYTKSVSNNVVKSVYLDKENNLWLGHFRGGVSISRNKNKFNNIKYSPFFKNSLSHSNVTTITKDLEGNTWLGTDGGGLNIIHKGNLYNKLNNNLSLFFRSKRLPQNILCLYEDNNENIWVGTYLDGLFIYFPKQKQLRPFKEVYPELELTNNDIRCITQDSKGKIWIGTNGGGVNIIDPKNKTLKVLRRYGEKAENSLTLDWITTIYEDGYGFVWIGTSYGVSVYDPVKDITRKYQHNKLDTNAISGNFINSIAEDVNNEIWIGTSYGLNKYNRKTDNFISYSVKDGLPSNIINAITDTKDGNLWISTNNGLSKYNIGTKVYTNYNITDGLAGNSFLNAAYYNDNNEVLYFGAVDGLTFFKTKEIQNINYKIPVILSDLKIFNISITNKTEFNKRKILENDINFTNSIKLLQRENVVTIDFAALSYSYSDKIEYEFRLLGFSDIWSNNSTNNSVTYTNLESGTYTFQVRVGNIGKDQPVKSLEITVLPPFYQTWGFRLSIAFLIILLAFLFIKQRLKNITHQRDLLKQKFELERLNAEKERINLQSKIQETEIRFKQDEMNYKNSQLVSTTMLLTHKNEKMNHIKNKISSFSRDVANKELKGNLKLLIDEINSEFKVEEDWKRFEEHFNDVHKDFIKRLKTKYPDLSITYLKLSAYLKLDLSSKEIASLMNITQRGVEKARSRLRKKMNLEPKESLTTFIAQI